MVGHCSVGRWTLVERVQPSSTLGVFYQEAKTTMEGIDAIVDSDEDGAEIFDDENSEEDNIESTPSSIRSTLSQVVATNYQEVLGALEVGNVESSSSSSSDDDDDDDEDESTLEDEKTNSSAEDYTDDEDEGEDGYKAGGYHPVKVGEVYNQRYEGSFFLQRTHNSRYVVVKKLGWGHFSTVWMVKDRKVVKNAQHFALKVQKSAEHYTEAAMDEVELLDAVSSERRKAEGELKSNKGNLRDVEHSRFIATLHDSFFSFGTKWSAHVYGIFHVGL